MPDADGALATWQQSIRPASLEEIKVWLTALWLETSHPNYNNEDLAGIRNIYARRLSRFPADIVKFTLEGWPERANGKWFPSSNELLEAIKQENKRRDSIGAALKGWGTDAAIRRRIRMIRYDIADAESGKPPQGAEVPDYMSDDAGNPLQGKYLDRIIPRYRKDMLARIAALVGSQHVDAVLEERKKSNTKEGQTK